jgi:hypothetical protein
LTPESNLIPFWKLGQSENQIRTKGSKLGQHPRCGLHQSNERMNQQNQGGQQGGSHQGGQQDQTNKPGQGGQQGGGAQRQGGQQNR